MPPLSAASSCQLRNEIPEAAVRHASDAHQLAMQILLLRVVKLQTNPAFSQAIKALVN